MCQGTPASSWLLACSFHINYTCRAALLSAAELLLALERRSLHFFHLCRKRLRLPVPVQHPQSIASEQSAEWELCPRGEFLPVGLGSGTHSSVSGVLLYELYSVLFRSNVVGKSMKGKRKDIWMRTRLVPPRLRK